MKVAELIDLLKQQNPEADVFTAEPICDGVIEMTAITGISPITSDHYGRAVLLELED